MLDINILPPLWKDKCFFHPAVSPWIDGTLMMTMQIIRGSDFFGPIEWCFSKDNGNTWSIQENILPLKSRQLEDGLWEGIADVRPFLHRPTQKIIAIGCNTYYSDQTVLHNDKAQYPVYATLSPDGSWSKKHILRGKCFERYSNYRVACTQLIVMPDGDVLIPLYLQENGAANRFSVCSILCSFDGELLKVKSLGNILSFPVNRGFIEPSLAFFDDKFYMTIRAEDDHAYYAVSEDGVNWNEARPWCWDSGEKLKTSSTQQHWLKLNGALYLLYTRKSTENKDVVRWRAPMFISRFDHQNGTLLRDTEQIVFPLVYHNGLPNLLGNFHVSELPDGNALVTVGSWWKSKPHHTEVWSAQIKVFKAD